MKKRRPLKRHPELIPLSREHHEGLILAQLLKSDVPDYKGLPQDTAGKVAYAQTTYEQQLRAHLEREETWLVPLSLEQAAPLPDMARRVLEEHRQIRQGIQALSEQSSPPELDALGRLIEQHIRFEEREWFGKLQERVEQLKVERK